MENDPGLLINKLKCDHSVQRRRITECDMRNELNYFHREAPSSFDTQFGSLYCRKNITRLVESYL